MSIWCHRPVKNCNSLICSFIFCLIMLDPINSFGQYSTIIDSASPFFKKVIAGVEYNRSSFHQWLWGRDYRKEWSTIVSVPVLNLDSAYGGLTPVKEGGGRQTKSLRLIDATGKQWVLRSVNKTYLGALPQIVQGTFVEKLANDQIATNHPYAALTIPLMANAAHIYHTNPHYYLVPHNVRLGEYNEIFANMLCLLEERPDDTQVDEKSFGEPEDIVSTEKMMEKVLEENDHIMDEEAYLKTRLFDMLIGDWGRHEDNWRWAKFDSGSFKIYRPVPKDRDQTFAKFEGVLLKLIIKLGKFKELQTFDNEIKNIKWYNYPAYEIDKRFTNSLSLQSWLSATLSLQNVVTDSVIENAVRQMPSEIFDISGKEIIRKIKSRRDHLTVYAKEYYTFLARNIEIPGTKESELFKVTRLNNDSTLVNVYRITKDGETGILPWYSRTFLNKETHEIRLYGIGGNDIFQVMGVAKKGIKITVRGGTGKDSMLDISYVEGWGHKTKFYDNPGNKIIPSAETKVHISRFPSINAYRYDVFKYNSRGLKPSFFYNNYYRFYIGADYSFTKNKSRDGSFSAKHSIGLNYSLIEKSFHPYYNGIFSELIGRWNFNVSAGYDEVRRFNYFGLGNESFPRSNEIEYHYFRLKNVYASLGIDQVFLTHHNIRLDFLYNGIKVIDDKDRFTSKDRGFVNPAEFNYNHFAGTQLSYSFSKTNNKIIPTKGINFKITSSYTKNLSQQKHSIFKTGTSLNIYLPLIKDFSIAIKSGASTLTGDPETYQYNTLGGYYTLRGFWRYRFYGRSVFYDQNELRWLPEVKGYWFTGKMGLVAFYDQGRVWQPGENSTKWHHGYGGGIILSPFNKIAIAVTYGISEETTRTNIRLGKFL
jgi:hypothetical protein